MASKGQKFNKYSEELRNIIVEEKAQGYSYNYLSRKYNISIGTLMTWYHKFNRPDLYPNQGQKKGPKNENNLTKEDWKERYEILKKYRAFLKAQREKK